MMQIHKTELNAFIERIHWQGGPGSVRDHAILEVFTMMMEEPVFDTLRTREQLGYSVFNTLRSDWRN